MNNHCTIRGDIFLCKQSGKLCFFQIADGIGLTVILSKDQPCEHAFFGQMNKHRCKSRAFIEVSEIPFEILGWKFCAQTIHFLRIDRKSLACASKKTRIGKKCASLAPTLDTVLWDCTRQNVERMQRHVRVRRME